jgi:hypothetical protein
MDLEFPTGFETAEDAHQAAAHAILSQDVAGDGLLVAATKTVGKLSLSAVGNRFSQKPHRSRILKSYSSSGTGLMPRYV